MKIFNDKDQFTELHLEELFGIIKDRTQSYEEVVRNEGIFLRHDIDCDFEKSFRIAKKEYQLGMIGTFFLLDTTEYWNLSRKDTIIGLRMIQDMGHTIGYHNNALGRWISYWNLGQFNERNIDNIIWNTLNELRSSGIYVHLTSAHGADLVQRYNTSNYAIWKGQERKDKLNYNQVDMQSFGLEYEVQDLPRKHGAYYISDSGGHWRREFTEEQLLTVKKINILLHPQQWKI